MKIKKVKNFDIYEITPKIFKDQRGHFFEVIRDNLLSKKIGNYKFVQENESLSKLGTFRGLHIQTKKLQGKLIRVLNGKIMDVSLDCRFHSKTYGKVFTIFLDSKKNNSLWIPPGYAHGFLVMSKTAKVFYKCTEYYSPKDQITIDINDRFLNLKIPKIKINKLIISKKDLKGLSFKEFSDTYQISK